MRNNKVINDCCDFSDKSESSKLNKTTLEKRNNYKLIVLIAVVLIAALLLIAITTKEKKNNVSPTEKNTVSEENDLVRRSNVISAYCRVAFPIVNAGGEHQLMGGLMKTAYYGVRYPDDVLFRTLVFDDNSEFTYFCEDNGFSKTDVQAKKKFVDNIAKEYGIENAALAYDTSEYSAGEYLFVADLTKKQINQLTDKGYFVELGIADGKSDTVTDSLEAIAEDGSKVLVEIVLDIDNFETTDNESFYADGIKELLPEQLNEQYVATMIRTVADENALEIVDKKIRLREKTEESGYTCNAVFTARLNKGEIYKVATDERVRFMDAYYK